MKTVSEKVDDAVHSAMAALGLGVAEHQNIANDLNDWITERVASYVTDDGDTG